jgi:hypothetical protein
MRERKELAAAQLPAPVRCIHCSSDGKLIAFGHASGLLSVFKTSEMFESSVSVAEPQDESKTAHDASLFWRSQPGSVTTGSLFAPYSSSSHAGASNTNSSASKSKSSATASLASELLAVRGCVYTGIHRRENITDVKFSPCGMCVAPATLGLRDLRIVLSALQVFSIGLAG